MPFSERLKELRLQNNLSQEKVAIKLKIATRTYIYYETGKRYPPVELLARMAEFFGVSISFLMDEQSEAHAQEGNREKLGEQQLFEEFNHLLARSELSETEKYAVMVAAQEAYRKAKKKNIQT